jgi:Protein of unknown function (DUF3307)
VNPYGYLDLPWYALGGLVLLAHLWYDFHVQGDYISRGKITNNLLLSVHATTWALTVSAPLYLVGTLTAQQFFFLLGTHWAMDWYKGHKLQGKEWGLAFDQVVHLLTLAVCLWSW